jgi:hypothetical protein
MRDDAARNGWRVIATLRHRPGRPTRVEVNADDTRLDIDAWSQSEGWCEHCRTRRARRTTYLLVHNNGRLAQVGSSCVAAFIASTTATRQQRSMSRARHRTQHPRTATVVDYIDTHTFLAHASQAVFDSGWVSAASATRRKPATWTTAVASLDRGRPPSAKAAHRARQAIAWARQELATRDALTDFQQRLVDTIAIDRLTRRELPTAAALIHAFHYELRDRIHMREKLGEHIGEPGDAICSTFTVHHVERMATTHGPVQRHSMTDELGRRALWDAEAGTLPRGRHRLAATITAHADVDGRRVTFLRDCRQQQ